MKKWAHNQATQNRWLNSVISKVPLRNNNFIQLVYIIGCEVIPNDGYIDCNSTSVTCVCVTLYPRWGVSGQRRHLPPG